MWTVNLIIEYFAWFLALIQLIVGLYILFLNPRQPAGRQAAGLLLVYAIHTYATGSLAGANNAQQAYWPTLMLSAAAGARVALILLSAMMLLKPEWVRPPGHARFNLLKNGLLLIALLPAILTAIDFLLGSSLYYTGLNPAIYRGGFVEPADYLQGAWEPVVNWITYAIPGLILMLFLGYEVLLDRRLSTSRRFLAVILFLAGLVTQVSGMLVDRLVAGTLPYLVSGLVTSTVILLAFAYATYQEVLTDPLEQGGRRSRLTTRLTGVTLIVSLPLLAGMGIFLTNQAQQQLEQDAVDALAASNRAALETIEVWLTANTRAIKTLAIDDRIASLDPDTQKPALQAFVAIYPDIYLAGTTNLDEMTGVRSDSRARVDYSQQSWFQKVQRGRAVSAQVVDDRAISSDVGADPNAPGSSPALVFAAPVKGESDEVTGVVMIATRLEQLSRLVQRAAGSGTSTAQVYLVDDGDYVLTHSDRQVEPGTYYRDQPAVESLRIGETGAIRFTDAQGTAWRAQVNLLSNGWGLVVQQDENSLFAPIRAFQGLGILVMLVGGLTLFTLSWSAVQQSLRPVGTLTQTAAAITAGDLNRVAPVESRDELGALAEAFNAMTGQMRDLIGGLENRVAERTRDAERRALQLQVTSEVAREAAAIRDPERLLHDTTRLISNRLGHYHVGIFLIEGGIYDSGSQAAHWGAGYAVLKAASSEGGQEMLRRGHRLAVGQTGIVGYVAGSGRPRIALDVGRDAVYFNNPYLPQTRSEAALPLKIQDQVIGVLDVQSHKAQAFNEDDLAILQILADQVALAIENARLIAESQQSVRELEHLYGTQAVQGWKRRLGSQPLVFRLDDQGVTRLDLADSAVPESGEGETKGKPGVPASPGEGLIEVPIELRGRRLGRLVLQRRKGREAGTVGDGKSTVGDGKSTADGENGAGSRGWTQAEQALLQTTAVQLAQALENARLLEEVQNRARQEAQVNQIVARAQSSLNLETVMRTAVQELAQTLNFSKVRIRLDTPASGDAGADRGVRPVSGSETTPGEGKGVSA